MTAPVEDDDMTALLDEAMDHVDMLTAIDEAFEHVEMMSAIDDAIAHIDTQDDSSDLTVALDEAMDHVNMMTAIDEAMDHVEMMSAIDDAMDFVQKHQASGYTTPVIASAGALLAIGAGFVIKNKFSAVGKKDVEESLLEWENDLDSNKISLRKNKKIKIKLN